MLRIQRHVNSEWGEVLFSYKQQEYEFAYHIPTREIFNTDSKKLIRMKCMALTVGTPLIAMMRSVYSLAVSVFRIFAEAYRYLDGGSFSSSAIYEAAFDSLRSVGYGVLLTRWAMQGVFTPYLARQQYGKLERELNRHADAPHHSKFYLAFCFQRRAMMPLDRLDDQNVEEKLARYIDFIDRVEAAFVAWSLPQLINSFKMQKAVIT